MSVLFSSGSGKRIVIARTAEFILERIELQVDRDRMPLLRVARIDGPRLRAE
jgi:hypothetical protein